MSLWDSVKSLTSQAGALAVEAGRKTKLRTDILLADRELNNRKRHFGVELYDHVAPMSTQASFWEGTEDDRLMSTLRPALLETQREISALELRRVKQKERINQAEVTRQAAFPKKAETWGAMAVNAGLAAGHAGNVAKLKTELAMIETQIRGHKEDFGIRMYGVFSELEDTQGWLPTDRHIRAMYDQTRRDLEQIELKRIALESELTGQAAPVSKSVSVNTTPTPTPTVCDYGVTSGGSSTNTKNYGPNNGGFLSSLTPTSYSTPSVEAQHPPTHSVTTPSWAAPSTSVPQPPWAASSSSSHFSSTPMPPPPAMTSYYNSNNHGVDPFSSSGSSGYSAPQPSAPHQPYDPFSIYAAAATPQVASTNRTNRTTPHRTPPPDVDLLDFTYND